MSATKITGKRKNNMVKLIKSVKQSPKTIKELSEELQVSVRAIRSYLSDPFVVSYVVGSHNFSADGRIKIFRSRE